MPRKGLRYKYTARGDCWPLYDTACRVDPKDMETIDPNYGGPTRDDVLSRISTWGQRWVF